MREREALAASSRFREQSSVRASRALSKTSNSERALSQLESYRRKKAMRKNHMKSITFQSNVVMGTVWNRMTVHQVMEGSQASNLGVKKGWMATAINAEDVTTPDMCVSMIENAKRTDSTFVIRFYTKSSSTQQQQQQQFDDDDKSNIAKLVRVIKTQQASSPSHDSKKQQKRNHFEFKLDERVFQGPTTFSPITPPRKKRLRYVPPESPQHRRLIQEFRANVSRSPSLTGNSVIRFIEYEKCKMRDRVFREPVIHIKGFASHLTTKSCQRHLDHFIDEIVKRGCKTLVWDGDSYGHDSFTAAIPRIWRRYGTYSFLFSSFVVIITRTLTLLTHTHHRT